MGIGIYIGRAPSITLSYLNTMGLLGSFVQYLRFLTGSIWTGIGFHLIFVYINRLVGTESTHVIQFSAMENELPMQITLLTSLGLIFIGLLVYPLLTEKKLGWKELA